MSDPTTPNPCPPPPVMSPRLLRRLAEASKGPHGSGEQFWVCRFEPEPTTQKFDLKGPFRTKQEADAVLAGKGPDFGVFGPFQHTKGQSAVAQAPVEILSITVKVKGEGDIEVDPRQFDALFWGAPAVEKFVLPYYASSADLDYAMTVRQEYESGRAFLLAHSGDSEHHVHRPKKTPQPGGGVDKLDFLPLD